ncbi:hypothetical protein [Mucilaginibacter pedocola]|nr:hypothetical protein [Mucilaginibacter pedocola]
MQYKGATNAESIIQSLTAVDTPGFARFKKSKIAQRILLLSVFINEKFEQPNRYSGNDRLVFDQFKALTEEQRTTTINTLRFKMDGL